MRTAATYFFFWEDLRLWVLLSLNLFWMFLCFDVIWGVTNLYYDFVIRLNGNRAKMESQQVDINDTGINF